MNQKPLDSPSVKFPVSPSATYKKVIESIDNLPSFPAVVSRLIKVVNSPESSADDAASLIERDPALTSKMIRLANSAFYGIPRSISSVSSAVVILGFNTIRSLVLSASVMKLFSGSHKQAVDKERFWKHSIVSAMAAKIIVRHFINVRMMDPESAFCSGILHDIGKLIFNEFMNDEYVEVRNYAEKNGIPLLDAENKILGINHAEICKVVSDKWSLPLDLEYSLVYHHNPGAADKLHELVATIHFADILAHDIGASLWDDEPLSPQWDDYRKVLSVSDADYGKIRQTLEDSMEKSLEFFNIIK
jgi:HD-like signal output (HDOD) protein